MPVMINNLKTKGFFKIKVELDQAFDIESEEEKEYAEEWAGAYLVLRELNAAESARMQEAQQTGMQAVLGEVVRDAIVDHNIYREENKKASSDEVVDIIKSSSTVYAHVIGEWVKHLPLARRSGANSGK